MMKQSDLVEAINDLRSEYEKLDEQIEGAYSETESRLWAHGVRLFALEGLVTQLLRLHSWMALLATQAEVQMFLQPRRHLLSYARRHMGREWRRPDDAEDRVIPVEQGTAVEVAELQDVFFDYFQTKSGRSKP